MLIDKTKLQNVEMWWRHVPALPGCSVHVSPVSPSIVNIVSTYLWYKYYSLCQNLLVWK